MKQKLKQFFDAKTTWGTLGIFAGTMLGDKAAAIVQGLGALVMAAI